MSDVDAGFVVTKHRAQLRGVGMAGLAMLLVGSTVVASKLIAQGLPPFTATALRFALALPCFLILLTVQGQRWPRPVGFDHALLILQAAAGSVGYTVLLILGLASVPGADAGVIGGTLPAFAALLGCVLLREWPRPRQWLGLGLAGIGTAVLQPLSSTPQGTLTGLGPGHLLLLAAVGCEALFMVLNKALRRPLAPLAQSSLMSAYGLLLALPLAWLECRSRGGVLQVLMQASPSSWLAVAYYACVPTVAGFWLWYTGAARLSAAQAGGLSALMPVSAVLLAVWLLGETWHARQAVGLLAVLASLALLLAPARSGRR